MLHSLDEIMPLHRKVLLPISNPASSSRGAAARPPGAKIGRGSAPAVFVDAYAAALTLSLDLLRIEK